MQCERREEEDVRVMVCSVGGGRVCEGDGVQCGGPQSAVIGCKYVL